MTEAMVWSVMKWLREKKSVRAIADQANAALDRLAEATQCSWPDELKAAYLALGSEDDAPKSARSIPKKTSARPSTAALLAAKRIKESDAEAYRARMDAEATFDEAEKKLSTSLAREGCRKAILSWDLKEKAIRIAEGMILRK